MEGCIWQENLRPMFEFASQLVGYQFDDLDWDAVALGVRETDYEAGAGLTTRCRAARP